MWWVSWTWLLGSLTPLLALLPTTSRAAYCPLGEPFLVSDWFKIGLGNCFNTEEILKKRQHLALSVIRNI
jgi:hypothetical protein